MGEVGIITIFLELAVSSIVLYHIPMLPITYMILLAIMVNTFIHSKEIIYKNDTTIIAKYKSSGGMIIKCRRYTNVEGYIRKDCKNGGRGVGIKGGRMTKNILSTNG
ncbi:unnamed protein product [Dovyalis caffra]|uniref:Uncharacterized protein n=1 Tax=Dovyalis caffra TaxID=77055 RepID=A0AAV1QUD0_9ROSI|nr:unnamed protein product [Dovyalis caffra]